MRLITGLTSNWRERNIKDAVLQSFGRQVCKEIHYWINLHIQHEQCIEIFGHTHKF